MATDSVVRDAAALPAMTASIGSQSFLQFIHAVGHDLNEYYDGDGPAEAAMAEKDHLLDPDAMASSIHAIYRPLERPRLQERLQTVDAPSSDASRTSPLGSPAMPVQDGSSGSADSDDEGDAVQDAQRAARPEQSPEGAPVPAPSDQGAPLATAAERRTNLADKLKEVFGLHEREDVVAEYQAFLFRSVLLQGYLYITTGHICFYAYLRAKEGQAIKSSSLSKRSRRSRRYYKYWFVLKDDVLRWYPNAAEPYFPNGDVSLHYVTSVQASKKNPLHFKVLTADRDLRFAAESTAQRDDWVKTLTKAVFQCQNEGDSVKISIPLETVVSVDKTSLDFIDALSLRVYDADNANTVDTYPFCYLANLQETYERLNAALRTFRNARPDLVQSSMDRIADTTAHQSLASSMTTSQLTTKLGPAAASTSTLSELVSRFNPFAASSGAERQRRPSTETITQARPTFTRMPSESEKHTYPPDHTADAPSESAGRTTSWAVPSVASWVKNAPKIINVARPSNMSIPLPGLAALGLVAGKDERKVTETVQSPTHHSGYISIHAEDEFGDTSVVSLPKAEPPSQVDMMEKDRELFASTFNVPADEELVYKCHAHIYRGLPIYGNLFLSSTLLCFKSTNLFSDTKMILPLSDVIAAQPHRSYRFGYFGLVLVVRRHEELFFELSSQERRDTMRHLIEQHADFAKQGLSDGRSTALRATGLEEAQKLEVFQTDADQDIPSPEDVAPIMFRSTSSSFVDFKPKKALHFTCLTIGSRGDVQPYIALCQGLIKEGHRCCIASHGEYRKWVESYGIEFKEVGGDPAELMRICVQHGMFTIGFMKEGLSKFRRWLDELLQSSWQACQGTDVLIESPSAMAGIHIAEALRIPYFRAFTMPWTRTRTYAHAFATPDTKLGGQYNYLSYTMFDTVFWRAIAGQMNRWRKLTLDLPPTSLDKLDQGKVPFLYNLSPSLMPPPLDWPEWVHVTGYWFLDNDQKQTGWTPPAALIDFIASARKENKKLVYIGFGSIVVADPEGLTKTVQAAVQSAGVAAIVSKGWSSRLTTAGASDDEKAVFERQQEKERDLLRSSGSIYTVDSIPHDWLFPQLDAVTHHGGSGTTGASLRAGIPTVIKPFFGDQFFQAERIEALGVGSALKQLTVESLAQALIAATTDLKQKRKADLLGQEIRSQNGVATAIEMIYRDMEYARSQIKQPLTRRPSSSCQLPAAPRTAERPSSTAHRSRSLSTKTDDGASISEDSSWDQLSSAADEVLSRSGIGSTPPRSLHGEEADLDSSGDIRRPRSRPPRPRSASPTFRRR